MSGDDMSEFEAQTTQAEENALVAEMVRAGHQLIEKVMHYQARVEQAAEVRAARPTRRRNGHRRPPGHLSQRVLDDLDQIGVLLEQAVAGTAELTDRGGSA